MTILKVSQPQFSKTPEEFYGPKILLIHITVHKVVSLYCITCPLTSLKLDLCDKINLQIN